MDWISKSPLRRPVRSTDRVNRYSDRSSAPVTHWKGTSDWLILERIWAYLAIKGRMSPVVICDTWPSQGVLGTVYIRPPVASFFLFSPPTVPSLNILLSLIASILGIQNCSWPFDDVGSNICKREKQHKEISSQSTNRMAFTRTERRLHVSRRWHQQKFMS